MHHPVPLSETDTYVLFREHNYVFLFDKDANQNLWQIDFYGDPTCGLLGLVNDWAVVGGDRLLIWKDNTLTFIDDPELFWITDMRQTGDDEIEILTDPWGEHPAIWKLDVMTGARSKLRDSLTTRKGIY